MRVYLVAAVIGATLGSLAVMPVGSVDVDCPAAPGIRCDSYTTMLIGFRIADPYPSALPLVTGVVAIATAVSVLLLIRGFRSARA
jgi:hypothetical protein